MMLLNISGQPLDEHMLKVIAMIPGKECYVSFEEVEEHYMSMLMEVGDILSELLLSKQYMKTIPFHTAMCEIKDVLDDIGTIKNFQQVYADMYTMLEEKKEIVDGC